MVYVLLETRISATFILHPPNLEHLRFQKKLHKLGWSISQEIASGLFMINIRLDICSGLPLSSLEL